jgi:hypothetical protein
MKSSTRNIVLSKRNLNLVLNLDAGNSASYPGSGTTWTDLAAAKTAILINGVGYSSSNGGTLTFDGANDYANIPTSTDFDLGNNYTIEMWLNPSIVNLNFGIVHRGLYSLSTNTWTSLAFSIRCLGSIFTPGTCRIYFYATTSLDEQFIDATALVANTWQQLLVIRNNTEGFLYKNNVLIGSVSGLNTPVASTRDVKVGLWDYSAGSSTISEYFPGKLSAIKIYKEALRPIERQQTFDAVRGRFDL